jgi:glutathione S-transferase
MKLYYATGACSLSPHIALLEAGVEATLVKVDTKTHKTADGGDFYAVNPKGYVPLLELDDGQRLSEGPVIVQYIADRNPASKLAPAAGTMERYRLQERLNFITTELHKQFSPLFQAATPAEYKEIAKEKIGKRFDWISTQLDGKDYLMGNAFTVADGYLFTMLSWADRMKFDLSAMPNLLAYKARVGARPAVQQALTKEGLMKAA